MVSSVLKRIAAFLPRSVQHELRRQFFRWQIREGRFASDEKEYALLDTLLRPGDWALDIGANVGHYTVRMAQLVGGRGRVIAFEPVPETFALLSANARLLPYANVSLINAAVSDRCRLAGMQIPAFADGLTNYYQAQLTTAPATFQVLSLSVDTLRLPTRIALAKIDVEGHELPVLRGMRELIERDRPMLIVETSAQETLGLLQDSGYRWQRLPDSSNVLCTPLRGHLDGDRGLAADIALGGA